MSVANSASGPAYAPTAAQLLEFAFVEGEALRLAHRGVRLEAEPVQIGRDRLDIFLAAPLQVGVVDPQQEPPTLFQREQRIVERGADVADVESAGR